MRKNVIAMIVLLVVMFALSACGGALDKPKNGTYRSDGILSQTWTFSGNNEITMSSIGGIVSSSGTYTISGDKLTITSSMLGTETTSGYTITEITSKSFFIDGSKFTKQ